MKIDFEFCRLKKTKAITDASSSTGI